jgi:hypothetical protein
MNYIDTSQISDPLKQQPFLGASLQFLQNAGREMVKGICRSRIGEGLYSISNTNGIVIAGCVSSSGGDVYSDGFIFFDDELYYFPGATGVLAFAPSAIFVESLTNDGTIDPITFSDLSTGSVHKIKRLVLQAGASGTGAFDLTDLLRKDLQQIAISTFTTSSGSEADITGATYTTPAGTRNYKIFFIAEVNGTGLATSVTGVIIRLKQAGSTIKTITPRSIDSDTTTQVTKQAILHYIVTGVAGGTTFKLTAERTTSGNQEISGGVFVLEEFSEQ